MEHTGTNSMTKLEAWQAWCAGAGTEQLADQLTLMKSSHGKAFSYAWDAAQRAEQNRVWTQDHWTEYEHGIRNATLDEIADKIAAMPFGDTAASFAVWIREQKK